MNALLLAIALSASTASPPAATAPVKKPAKTTWTCGQPQALATDRVQTVRYCEFK